MRWGIAAVLALLVGCANAEVISVPGCTCRDDEVHGTVCFAERCDPHAQVCHRADGSFCVNHTSPCDSVDDVPRCEASNGMTLDADVVCVSVELARTLGSCE